MNRLSTETSPYLQQHAQNPVDWYPWGEEAFARARVEDLPILLSVGYSACHWCHVMERESFEDEATARLMNERFVSVKVDREERPDVDSLYMTAVQQMTGRGGWPMTVFLTPAGEPFYGGTYFPPEPRHGMPSFTQVLLAVSEAWRERRGEVERGAGELTEAIRQSTALSPPPEPLGDALLNSAFAALSERFDEQNGGFGGAPKFPQPLVLDFLLRYWRRTGNTRALHMVECTLDTMASGGMYDHLGGGFHRYSVDALWHVPHFEKMLYDNALLARLYLHAHQATGRAEYRRVAEEVLDYLLREMASPEGGCYSAEDADSEGEEGRFYTWSAQEIDRALGPEEGPLFRRHYGVGEVGEPDLGGRSVLHATGDLDEEAVKRGRARLLGLRAERVRPARDEKVLTGWNALVLRSLAEAARILDRDDYREAAVRNADFLLRELRRDGALLRTWRDGEAKIGGLLEDYALLADALVSLYEATFEVRWIAEARALAGAMLDHFWETEEERFYDAEAATGGLPLRPRDPIDNATPSGSSAAAEALLRLAALTGDADFERTAEAVLKGVAGMLARVPLAFGAALSALDRLLATPLEVVVAGERGAVDTDAFLSVLRARYLPNAAIALRDAAAPDTDAESIIPLLAGRTPVDGHAAAYLCERFACRRPVTEPEELAADLDALSGVAE